MRPWYLQAAVVALRDLVKGDVQERDLVVTQDFVTVEDLGREERVSDTDEESQSDEFAHSQLCCTLTFSLSPQLSSYLVSM